jgi:hypothetical protein
MSTKAKTETDLIEAAGVGGAGGVRSEPGGRAEQPAGGAPLAIPDAVRDRLSDWVIDELLAGARTEEEIVGPGGVRAQVYTTNAIEALNRQLRKATKTKGHFPTQETARKLIYLAITNTAPA